MSFGYDPICYSCKHFDHFGVGFRCAAYPFGIPREIIMGDIDHKEPYFNDNGIQYEYAYFNSYDRDEF